MRKRAIEIRANTQNEIIDKMVADKTVSPRTYQIKKIELQNWIKQENEDLKSTKNDLEKGMQKALDSIKRT